MRIPSVPRRVLSHSIIWVVFITYELTIVFLLRVPFNPVKTACYYLLDIVLFYSNTHIVFNYAYRNKRPLLKLILFALMELIIFTGITLLVDMLLYNWDIEQITYEGFVKTVWRAIYLLGLSTAYWFFIRTIEATKRANEFKILQLKAEHKNMEAEKDLIKAQNAYLQAQINPHFLFNVLNFIYNTVSTISPKASEGILQLSDIMRYSLTEVDDDGKVPLIKEIEQIQRYISLSQMRFDNRLFVTLNVSWDKSCDKNRIPPLLLLTFVENIFKHGDLTDETMPAVINISCLEQYVHLYTWNKQRKSRNERLSNIGIKNARTRLNNYYATGSYSLSLQDLETKFTVDLKIAL